MNYLCRCNDGPAMGHTFKDNGPAVVVEIPFEDKVLLYHLSEVSEEECIYHLHEPSVKDDAALI